MAIDQRKKIFAELEAKRGTKILSYVTGDRPAGGPGIELALNMEPTVVPCIHDALSSIGHSDSIDLFLYTRGGAIDVVWPIVSLIREYAKKRFCVIIPFRAHSAGTLLALGADQIIMCESAELTSVDPTAGNVFNPVDETDNKKRKGISVEDVSAYFSFARDRKKVNLTKADHILEVFKQLTSQLHPLALGHVQRVHTQIRMIAEKLLRSHLSGTDAKRVPAIVEMLTEKLYSHTQVLNRRECKGIFGDIVVFPDKIEETLAWSLHEKYSNALALREPQNLLGDLGGSQQITKPFVRGFVETGNLSLVYESEVRLTVYSNQAQGAMYGQAAQQQLANISSAVPGLPIYVPGLPTSFSMDVLFEGWRANNRNV